MFKRHRFWTGDCGCRILHPNGAVSIRVCAITLFGDRGQISVLCFHNTIDVDVFRSGDGSFDGHLRARCNINACIGGTDAAADGYLRIATCHRTPKTANDVTINRDLRAILCAYSANDAPNGPCNRDLRPDAGGFNPCYISNDVEFTRAADRLQQLAAVQDR